MLHRIIFVHIVLYSILSYHNVFLLQCIISYIISYYIILYHVVSYHIISYHIISYHIISYHIILYHIISYYIILYFIISYHIISYHIILYYIILYYIILIYIIDMTFPVKEGNLESIPCARPSSPSQPWSGAPPPPWLSSTRTWRTSGMPVRSAV